MAGYTKLFSSLIHSTIWREADHVRLVWITMLAICDRDGVVEASIPGLADAARVTLEQCEEALERLLKPDRYSRSKDHSGRRIEECDGGWVILNYTTYRAKASAEERRIKTAERVRKHREIQKCNASVTHVTQNNDIADPDPTPDPTPEIPLVVPPEKQPKRKPTRKAPAVVRPASWAPKATHRDFALDNKLNIAKELAKFQDYHDSKESRFVNWDAAFRTWLRNAVEFSAGRHGNQRPQPHRDHGPNPYFDPMAD